MTTIQSVLTSPEWWFTVVIAGVLINVIAAFLFRPLDRKLSEVSERWRARSANRRLLRNERVELLRKSDRFLLYSYFQEIRFRLIAIDFALVAVFGLLVATQLSLPQWAKIATMLLAGSALLMARRSSGDASGVISEIRDSRSPTESSSDSSAKTPSNA